MNQELPAVESIESRIEEVGTRLQSGIVRTEQLLGNSARKLSPEAIRDIDNLVQNGPKGITGIVLLIGLALPALSVGGYNVSYNEQLSPAELEKYSAILETGGWVGLAAIIVLIVTGIITRDKE